MKNMNLYQKNLEDAFSVGRPIHCYSKKKTMTGRVCGEWRRFERPGGSCQYVFYLSTPTGKDGRKMELELYVAAGQDRRKAEQFLSCGQVLEVNYCYRVDRYINRIGCPAKRHFLFIDGLDDIRSLYEEAIIA